MVPLASWKGSAHRPAELFPVTLSFTSSGLPSGIGKLWRAQSCKTFAGTVTITLSNFGMIGGRFASLVVVPPQVAIIGAGRAEQRVVVDRGQQVIRRMLPLSLTFDHRVVTEAKPRAFLLQSNRLWRNHEVASIIRLRLFLTGIPAPLVFSPRLLAPCRSHQADPNSAAFFWRRKSFDRFLSFF